MTKDYTKMLLVSANVGSIFEDPEKMLKLWLQEFLATVKRLEPGFLAIHCQEVGGKNYEDSMKHVNSFVKALFSAEEMQNYDRSRFFLDEDFTAVEQFTALGNIYFIHNTVQNVQIFDFQECQFVPLQGREVLSGNIASISIKEKAKFPQEFFPDFKWSRKGFIRTRWNIQNSIFDLVNIHLFHDASNIVAMESSPSQYSNNRERTLRHTLNRFDTDQYDNVPLFLFGDFNFRLDTHRLIKKLTEESTPHQTKGKKNDISKIVFKHKTTEEVILTIEKKAFDHHQHKEVFLNNNGHWLHEFDSEALPFRDKLLEQDVTFPPSYPFSEDTEDGTSYMKTRCPSWCDRIMYTPSSKSLFYDQSIDYNMIGPHICMGDHKPIYLAWKLRHNTGNDDSDVSVTEGEVEPRAHRPLGKVISINGEEVSANDLNDINIHDYASFERSEHITREFMSSIKRKEGGGNRLSFRNVVKDVIRKERIMKALKHYSHRSDSETEDTDEEHNHNSKENSMEISPLVFDDDTAERKHPPLRRAVDTNKNEAGKMAKTDQVISNVDGCSDNNNAIDVKAGLAANNNVVTAHSPSSARPDDVTVTIPDQNTHGNKSTSQNQQNKVSANQKRDTKGAGMKSSDAQGGEDKKKEKKCCVIL